MSGGAGAGEGEGKKVCVTGASGYIASWLVKLLLSRGYTVNATVRNPNDPAKTGHLLTLEGAKERLLFENFQQLQLFKADLMEEGSFDSAISGCQGVFHTAAPVNFNVTDPQAEVLDPAVKGTLNVLAACKRSPSVRRVVFTSSTATVLCTGKPLGPEVVIDETWFSKPEFCNEYPNMKWYIISKILAEEAAWKFCKENGIDLVSVNPGMVIGPMLPPTLNESVAVILNIVNGAETYANVALPWVHIEDVGKAHIQAFENPSASGRYCLVESVVHHKTIVALLHELYPSLRLPHKCADDEPLAKTYQVSKARTESLGIVYTNFKNTLKDTVKNLKEKNFPMAFRT